METIHIDGSFGEGGGQILRTSLAMAGITGKRLQITNIRAKRDKPGLGKQHLACVEAACKVCNAKCKGDELRSMALDFMPGEIQSGNYKFDIGSAGSALLVAQTVLPILFNAKGASKITVTGGTHNTWAPPYDFIMDSFLPVISAAGFKAECKLEQYGFYPAGGGKISFEINPYKFEKAIDLCDVNGEAKITAKIYTSKLPINIAQKQRKLLVNSGLKIDEIEHVDVRECVGAGNCVVISIVKGNHTSVFTGFGAKGKPSEKVIAEVVNDARDYQESGAAIEHHLADQLVIYMGIQKTGRFITNRLTKHLTTNMEVIKKFLTVDFSIESEHNYYKIICGRL